MTASEHPPELSALAGQVEDLRRQLMRVETETRLAVQEAHLARAQVLLLQDKVAAAERDQQDLRTARTRLARMKMRGLWARIMNRH